MTFQDRLALTSFRGPGFDHVRLLAATTVLLHHSRGLQYVDVRDDPLLHYSAGYMDFGRLAVVVFFAISGFLVTPGLQPASRVVNYAVNRCVRIFPGLMVNVALTILLLGPFLTTLSLGAYFRDPQTYLYAKNVLTLLVDHLPGVVGRDGRPASVNGALWTLHFEVLCYVLLGLLSLVGALSRRNFVLALWCACYAVYITIGTSPPFTGVLFERFWTFLGLFIYFGSGVLLSLFRAYVPYSRVLACAAFGLLVIALPLGGGPVVMPICLPYLMVFCGLSALPGKVPLKHDLSYGVYLIHAPVLLAFSLAFPTMNTWWIGAVVVFVVTLMLAYASWILIEGPALRRKKLASDWARRCIELIFPPLKAPTPVQGAAVQKIGNLQN